MKTKEEVIKEAWGADWNSVKKSVSKNGYVSQNIEVETECDIFCPIKRPKSLQGIETNNGWVKIESEADLPNEDGLECYIIGKYHDALPLVAVFDSRHGDGKRFYNMNGDVWSKDVITHYQPIIKPKPPIY